MSNPFNMKNVPSNYIKDLYKAVAQSNNPYETFIKLAGNNPQMQPIINAIRQGSNPKQIFDEICQKRGVNPQEFINNITK